MKVWGMEREAETEATKNIWLNRHKISPKNIWIRNSNEYDVFRMGDDITALTKKRAFRDQKASQNACLKCISFIFSLCTATFIYIPNVHELWINCAKQNIPYVSAI